MGSASFLAEPIFIQNELCIHSGGEGKRVRSCVLATPAREWRLSGSTSKNGTSRKRFQEAYSTDEVARQACPVFGSSTFAGVTKTPARPSLPFLTRRLHNVKRIKDLKVHRQYASPHRSPFRSSTPKTVPHYLACIGQNNKGIRINRTNQYLQLADLTLADDHH